jgi:hypothetical protein
VTIEPRELAWFIAPWNPGASATPEVYVVREPSMVPRLHAETMPAESSRVFLLRADRSWEEHDREGKAEIDIACSASILSNVEGSLT